MKYKSDNKTPKHPLQIVIMGPPSTQRATLARELCAKFGFVYISTVEILKDFVNKNGKLSNLVAQSMQNRDLSKNFDIIIF